MKIFTSLKSKYILKVGIVFIWLVIWEITSHIVNNGILLVGPSKVVMALGGLVPQHEFWTSIWGSLIKIGLGFFLGVVSGILLAILSYRISFIRQFLQPFMSFIKATPVASFVVLFLIWWHADALSVAISLCIVLPQIYSSMLAGFDSMDGEMLVMASSYKLNWLDTYRYIYKPSLAPFMEAAVKVSVGLAWKSGVAAEVIGTPDATIGERLYMSKIYLDTEGVLAWTLVIILLSGICEQLILKLYKLYNRMAPACHGSQRKGTGINKLVVNSLTKSYGDRKVLDGYNADFEAGKIYQLDWESGSGKTTLFKCIGGEIAADSGRCEPEKYETSRLFQEDRLCEHSSAIKNVELVCGDSMVAHDELCKLLEEELLDKPVCELSGGQKRRVAIVRAAVSDADIYLLDEPYNGLDEANREKVSEYIQSKLRDKIVVIASHIGENIIYF